MYFVERTESKLIVRGPEGFEKSVSTNAIGIVLRQNSQDPYDDIPQTYTVAVKEMTDSEVVAMVLGLLSFA